MRFLVAAFCLIFAVPIHAAPNILFVLIDDMGYGDLGCFGGTRVATPNIDKLAAEGLRFTQFYVNSPICSPSRVALTTGQYPNRWRITSYLATRQENGERGMANWLDLKAPTLARLLGRRYYTVHIGKWHMGGQRDVGDAPRIMDYGFATSLTNFEGLGERVLPLFEPTPDGKPFVHGPTQMSARLRGGPIHWVQRHQVTEAFVDEAIEQIEKASKLGIPFYMNLWPDDVHSPCQAPPGERGDGSPAANYLGVLKELDRQLGRVFGLIRSREDLRDNTIILLASDNGPESGLGTTGGLRGSKGQLYEGGIRSPLIVWSAKIPAEKRGTRNETTVIAGMDLPPSLLALSGMWHEGRENFDGLDAHEALLGQSAAKRKGPIMWVRPPDRPGPDNSWPDLAIRYESWKLLTFRDRSHPELYDIAADPSETRNLAADQPHIVRMLGDRVIKWERSIGNR